MTRNVQIFVAILGLANSAEISSFRQGHSNLAHWAARQDEMETEYTTSAMTN